MDASDLIYTTTPFYGTRRISKALKLQGLDVGRKKVRKYMRLMGIEPLYAKPKTTVSHPEHTKYPYLLKNMTITRPNQVRSSDITYVRLKS